MALASILRWFGARNANDADFLPPAPLSYCEEGTVGWDDADASNYYELGTAANDGYMLVRVQLFVGKPPHIPIKSGIAQGYRLLCRVASVAGIQEIPPPGTVVLVLLPGGDTQTPGRPVIACSVKKNPTTQIDPLRITWDVGNRHLVLRGTSVSLQDNPPGGGASCFVSVGTPFTGGARGVFANNEQGSGFSATASSCGTYAAVSGTVKSTCALSSTEADLFCNDGGVSGVQAKGGDVSTMGANNNVVGGQVRLGNPATISSLAVNGVAISVAGPANVISATVLAST